MFAEKEMFPRLFAINNRQLKNVALCYFFATIVLLT